MEFIVEVWKDPNKRYEFKFNTKKEQQQFKQKMHSLDLFARCVPRLLRGYSADVIIIDEGIEYEDKGNYSRN